MIIRRERPDDADRIHQIHASAFGQPLEADLAVALRVGGHAVPELSLVAEREGEIVGHVVCSRGELGGRPALGLGPIGVRPERQGDGVGSALMHAVLAAADALGEPLVVLLGSPAYYRRFGFVPAADLGVEAPDPAWAEHFQARPLTAHDASWRGRFRYAAPFDQV